MRKGLIKREPTVYKGRKTYKLVYKPRKPARAKLLINLNPVIEIPCFVCRELDRCGIGGYFNPHRCALLSRFIMFNGSRT